MIALVEGAKRQRTPERDRAVDPALGPDARVPVGGRHAPAVRAVRRRDRRHRRAGRAPGVPHPDDDRRPAVGHRDRGMDRVARFNVLAMSGRAVEASGDVDVILLDKTGTITYGNRLAASIVAGARRRRRPRRSRPRSSRRSATRPPRADPSSSSPRASTRALGASAGTGDDAGLRGSTRRSPRPRRSAPRPAPAASRLADGGTRPQGRGRRHRRQPRRRRCPPSCVAESRR